MSATKELIVLPSKVTSTGCVTDELRRLLADANSKWTKTCHEQGLPANRFEPDWIQMLIDVVKTNQNCDTPDAVCVVKRYLSLHWGKTLDQVNAMISAAEVAV